MAFSSTASRELSVLLFANGYFSTRISERINCIACWVAKNERGPQRAGMIGNSIPLSLEKIIPCPLKRIPCP